MPTFVVKRNFYILDKKKPQEQKLGGSLKSLVNQVNNPSIMIPNLGTGSMITVDSPFKPTGNSISYGGSLSHGLKNLNFNSSKNKKDKNIKLKP